jgi:hypothetical protein
MHTADTCPFCREELCEGRPRVPASTPEPAAPLDRTAHDEDTVSDEGEPPSCEELLNSGLNR